MNTENQISVDNQNTEQVEQNLTDQTSVLQERPRVNYWKISTIILSLLLVCLTGLFVWKLKRQPKKETPSGTAVSQIESPTPTVTTSDQDMIPEKNSLFLGIYEGKEVIFYTNDLANQGGSGAGGVKIESGPYTGAMAAVGAEPLSYSNPYDFKKLVNPKKIANNFPSLIGLVADAKYGSDKDKIYASLILDSRQDSNEPYVSSKNVIYRIDIDSQEKQEIWSSEMKKGKYQDNDTDFAGAADIDQVIEDKYLILSIGLCFDCSPYSEKRGFLILNINSQKEKFIGMVGDIVINSSNNTFAYKNLEAFIEPCPTNTAYCNDSIGDGNRYVYKPTGQDVTENLP